jgi:hypothetical protein
MKSDLYFDDKKRLGYKSIVVMYAMLNRKAAIYVGNIIGLAMDMLMANRLPSETDSLKPTCS